MKKQNSTRFRHRWLVLFSLGRQLYEEAHPNTFRSSNCVWKCEWADGCMATIAGTHATADMAKGTA